MWCVMETLEPRSGSGKEKPKQSDERGDRDSTKKDNGVKFSARLSVSEIHLCPDEFDYTGREFWMCSVWGWE